MPTSYNYFKATKYPILINNTFHGLDLEHTKNTNNINLNESIIYIKMVNKNRENKQTFYAWRIAK